MKILDQDLREKALNPVQSFIVQAPAGSGKTELLTQRFLKLLNTVEKPEEIVAITFTRKAAAEMRQRIVRALNKALLPETSDALHEKMTRQLALQALEKDRKLHWNLIENPNRLRILTIDALCASICAQTPILSQLGGQPKIMEDAQYFYRLASREFLTDVTHPAEVSEKIEKLLLHLDNRVYQLQSLFTQILSKREQWLSHIMGFHQSPELLKKHLEKALIAVSDEAVKNAETLFSAELKTKVINLLEFSKATLSSLQAPSSSHSILLPSSPPSSSGSRPPSSCDLFAESILIRKMDPANKSQDDGSVGLSDGGKSEKQQWQAIANLLLTQAGTFRKTVNKNLGFPPKHPMKTEMEELLESLSENEKFEIALHELLQSPPSEFSENQWEILEALLVILPRLTAQLQVIFAENSVVDFVEFSLRASFALGTEENPTDLALYLDHQIRHLLIDEFQDTSITQFTLIEKLMFGWAPGDGRSIFLVGDPMQSIYRFREANVGLFLRAQTQGIAGIPLHFIPLSTNFRSDTQLVNWFNKQFPNLFPTYSDLTTGAVPYSPAVAAKMLSENSGVYFYPSSDEYEEADQVVKLIQKIHSENSEESIAILVRSRSQLLNILPTLSKNNIQYHALEIESLGDRPEIQDLLTLTRALLHLGDRLSWLALLRAPFCGLKLEDLHAIAQAASHRCIWEVMLATFRHPGNCYAISGMTSDGYERLQRIVPILQHSIAQKGRLPTAQWIEGTWLALSGPLVLNEKSEEQNADVFFETLAKLDEAHQALPLKQLSEKIQKMSASPKTPGNYPIQVMTIHKSKGLEFDHVILPGLNKTSAQDQNQLLLWLERANSKGGNDLLLAPIKAAEDENDPIYAYLRKVEKNKASHELIRLLYVALTRAKISAHCIAQLEADPKNPEEFVKPSRNSFLGLLWESFSTEINQYKINSPLLSEKNFEPKKFMRIMNSALPSSRDLFAGSILSGKMDPANKSRDDGAAERDDGSAGRRAHGKNQPPAFNSNTPALIGTLIHLALEKLALGKKMPDAFFKNRAMMLGLPSHQWDFALAQIHRAVENILADEKGQWILKARENARNEISLSAYDEDGILPMVIDRTFCDEDGTRWIIDYKTSTPNEENLGEFLSKESKRYLAKLEQYAKAFARIESRPIRVALYFPLIPYYFEIEELVYAL